tara:strand:- start:1879 stop:2433 length:555 start_codon:yes stop_codon:yes gene_type:complete
MKSEENDYLLVNWGYIKDNQAEFIKDLAHSHESITKFGIIDSTKNYHAYNIFGASSPSVHMYKLYGVIRELVRRKLPDEDFLWMQSWVNYQTRDNVLDWHNHDAMWHGYVSIDPKDTCTEFKHGFKVDNEVGNIYFGPGFNQHRVVNNSEYEGIRITVAFDIMTSDNFEKGQDPTHNFGMMPLL